MNPWYSIWREPRKTIAHVSHESKDHGIFWLSMICGFLSFINVAQYYALGLKIPFWSIILLVIVLSPVLGYLYLSVASWLVLVTGKWFRGHATFRNCRLALAWSYVPLLFNVVVWVILLLVVGERLFKHFPAAEPVAPGIIYLVLGLSLVQVAGGIWALVIYLHALAEVQHFTVTKAIGNVVVATLLFLCLVFILWLIAAMLWVHLL